MYILFEGVDTSGKSTQIELLRQDFPDAIYTKEPGGTSIGLEFRKILLEKDISSFKAELFLFLADRAEHYEQIIKPHHDKLILSDRGFVSGMAYALTNHPNLDMNFLLELNRFALDGNLPDRVLFFKTNKELIQSRLFQKQKDSIEKRGIDYLLKVQENMQRVLESLEIDFWTIDSSDTVENINTKIKGLLS